RAGTSHGRPLNLSTTVRSSVRYRGYAVTTPATTATAMMAIAIATTARRRLKQRASGRGRSCWRRAARRGGRSFRSCSAAALCGGLFADRLARHHERQLVGLAHRTPVEFDDHVADLQTGGGGRPVLHDVGDERAARLGQSERLGDLRRHLLNQDPEPAAGDLP